MIGFACAFATTAMSQAPATRPEVIISTDTALSNATQWPLRIQTTTTTRVTVALAPVAPDAPPLHTEFRVVTESVTFWPLRSAAGTTIEPGIYRLQIVTQDSATGVEHIRTRVIAVQRAQPDTQPHPPALDRAAFLPESTSVRSHRPGYLLIAGIGVASLATAATFEEGSVSPITIAIPAALAIGGVVGYLRGRTSVEVVPENAAHNRKLVAADATAREAVIRINESARANATLRIRVLDQP